MTVTGRVTDKKRTPAEVRGVRFLSVYSLKKAGYQSANIYTMLSGGIVSEALPSFRTTLPSMSPFSA